MSSGFVRRLNSISLYKLPDLGSSKKTDCGSPLTNRQGAQPVAPAATVSKSRVAAGLLGIFLGGLGVHNFYLGYNEKGIWQVILFVLCCGVPSSIWGFVEGILILMGKISTDAAGNPLND